MKVCTKCNTNKPLSEYYHKGKKSDGKLQSECKTCFNARMMKRFEEKARKVVALKGGSCNLCGYDRCVAALEFHHVDPSEKEFQISKRWSMKDERLLAEIEKCVLLCANCHREVHYRLDRGEDVVFNGR